MNVVGDKGRQKLKDSDAHRADILNVAAKLATDKRNRISADGQWLNAGATRRVDELDHLMKLEKIADGVE